MGPEGQELWWTETRGREGKGKGKGDRCEVRRDLGERERGVL